MSTPQVSIDGTSSNISFFSSNVAAPIYQVVSVNSFGSSTTIVDTGAGHSNRSVHIRVNVSQTSGTGIIFVVQTSSDGISWFDNATHENGVAVRGDNFIHFQTVRRYFRLSWRQGTANFFGTGTYVGTKTTISTQPYVTVSNLTGGNAIYNGNYYLANYHGAAYYGYNSKVLTMPCDWINQAASAALHLYGDGGGYRYFLDVIPNGANIGNTGDGVGTDPSQFPPNGITISPIVYPSLALAEVYPAGVYSLAFMYGAYINAWEYSTATSPIQQTYTVDYAPASYSSAGLWETSVAITNGTTVESTTPYIYIPTYNNALPAVNPVTLSDASIESYFAGFTQPFTHSGGPIGIFPNAYSGYGNANSISPCTWSLTTPSSLATFFWDYAISETG